MKKIMFITLAILFRVILSKQKRTEQDRTAD